MATGSQHGLRFPKTERRQVRPSRSAGVLQSKSASSFISWSLDGHSLSLGATAVLVDLHHSAAAGRVLTTNPRRRIPSEQEVARLPGARKIDTPGVVPGPLGVYAFYRSTIQRNLYRIPIP